jgi:hypothetical protein
MAFEANMTAKILGLYDNELLLSHYEAGNKDKFISRDSLSNMHQSGGTPEPHPTIPNVIKNTNGHIFINGSFRFEWEWNVGTIPESDVDAYLNLFSSENLNPHFTITKDFANNKLIGNLLIPNDRIDNWVSNYIRWHIAAPRAKCTFTSDESEIVCVTRINNTFNQYSFDQRTVEAGQTLEIERPNCNTCYVMFTDLLLKTGTDVALMRTKMYKLVNPSISVTNNNSSRVRILRYYK